MVKIRSTGPVRRTTGHEHAERKAVTDFEDGNRAVPYGVELTEQEFWQAMQKSAGPKRVPPTRKKAAAKVADDDSSEDGE